MQGGTLVVGAVSGSLISRIPSAIYIYIRKETSWSSRSFINININTILGDWWMYTYTVWENIQNMN